MNFHRHLAALGVFGLLALASPAGAQPDNPTDTRPAFSLYSSHIATTRERPSIDLMFRHVSSLDFRVYRVQDPVKFFAGLRDPHALGSEAPTVPQEQTLLERIARWKAAQREAVRAFIKAQFSWQYRTARREANAKKAIALRQPLHYNKFAQVPLLNSSGIVSSWREMLPLVRDAEMRRIPLDLPGPGVYVVEAISAPYRAYTIVVVSDLGLVTKSSPGQLVLFAANRFTGEPAGGCETGVVVKQAVVARGSSDADGLFEAPLGQKPEDVIAIARCGQQIAATDPGGWYFEDPARRLIAYVYTDKPIYRPGHVVNLKAVLRWRAADALQMFDRKQVEVSITDPNEKVVFRQEAAVDEFGSVLATFPVPAGAALGYYSVRIGSEDLEAGGHFEVQEYRKPDFEVIVKPAERFVVQGGKAVGKVTARYYFGQPVANAVVKYVVHKQPYFSPLRWTDEDDEGRQDWWFGDDESKEGTLRLDAQGQADIAVPLPVEEKGRDYSVRIEARVTDASSREVSGNTIVHATHGRFMLVVRADNYVHRAGEDAVATVRAIDYLGAPQPNVTVTTVLERVRYSAGERSADRLSTGTVTTDASGFATWKTTLPKEAGEFELAAEAQSEGRTVRDSAWTWVPGKAADADVEGEERELELVPDKSTYQPGDVARLSIRGDASPTAVLVTKEGQQVSWRRVLRPAAGAALEVPIADGDVGDIYVNIAFLRDDRLYRAEKRLKVPATSRQLQVAVTADQPVSKPGVPGQFTVKVSDAAGQPIRAQVSLGVIDEAVYGVKPDTTPDPLRFFYRREYSRVGTQFSREYTFVGYSGTQQLMLAQRRRPLALADFKADRPAQPQVRKEFPDAIYWLGNMVTGQDGTARVQLRYPDSLTTWRLTARVVTTDTRVGQAVTRTTTTKDLIVRVVTPRFLTEGDEVVVPTLVHNYLPAAKTIAVGVKADGVDAAGAGAGGSESIELAQGGEQRLDRRFTASRPGTATFTSSAKTDTDADAVELSIPVLPFGLKQQVGAAGSISGEGERAADLAVPATANPAGRVIRVSMAPSLAGPLLGALDYLTSYPYGCTEQTLSSFLPNLAVLRALDQLKMAPTDRLRALDRQVSEGLQRLYDYQHDDGGWGWWKTDENHPFMTAYAVYGLLEAQAAGYKVDAYRISNGARSLRAQFGQYPRAVPDLKAYVAYVLTVAATKNKDESDEPGGRLDSVRKIVEQTWTTRDRMSAYGRALLLLTLDALKDGRATEVARSLTDSAQKNGDLAWWKVENDPLLEDYTDTSVEATAFAVKALAAREPNNPLLEPAVRWLLLNRNYGTWWSSTKQTAMVLLGLLDYMRARQEGAADATVEVLVNGASAGTTTFNAASLTSPDPVVLNAPATAGTNHVQVRKRGGGVVYWAATAEYFDKAGPFERTGSRKLAIARQYFSLTPVEKDKRIVYRETPFDGRARPGDVLLVRVNVAGSADWRYLMIEDPLPAGVEAVRDSRLYSLEKPRQFWDGSRREYRDSRIVFFQQSFTEGHYEFVYLLKVTTPGVFRAMPAQVSAMYIPGARASSEPQTITVADEAAK
jgi:alpha-2-macroglobulin